MGTPANSSNQLTLEVPMGKSSTTEPGYVNRNRQTVVRDSGLPGTDHLQRVYVLRCNNCDAVYGANGSDVFERKCPACQDGAPGLTYHQVPEELKQRARDAFLRYEAVFIARVVKKPGWRLSADHCESVLATGDETRLKAYIDDLNAGRRDLESALIV